MNDRAHANTIKKQLVEALGIDRKNIRVKWGKGTARYYLTIYVPESVYKFKVEDLSVFLHQNREAWGTGNWHDDYGDSYSTCHLQVVKDEQWPTKQHTV